MRQARKLMKAVTVIVWSFLSLPIFAIELDFQKLGPGWQKVEIEPGLTLGDGFIIHTAYRNSDPTLNAPENLFLLRKKIFEGEQTRRALSDSQVIRTVINGPEVPEVLKPTRFLCCSIGDSVLITLINRIENTPNCQVGFWIYRKNMIERLSFEVPESKALKCYELGKQVLDISSFNQFPVFGKGAGFRPGPSEGVSPEDNAKRVGYQQGKSYFGPVFMAFGFIVAGIVIVMVLTRNKSSGIPDGTFSIEQMREVSSKPDPAADSGHSESTKTRSWWSLVISSNLFITQRVVRVRLMKGWVFALLAFVCLGCSEEKESSKTVQPTKVGETRAENLEKLMRRLQSAVLEGEEDEAIELARNLFPSQGTLSMACSAESDPESYRLISRWLEEVKPRNPRNYLKLYPFREWQSEVIVTSMTGSELASVSGKPDGFHEDAAKLARAGVLRVDQEFYSVNFRYPEDEVGQRYEVFVWDPGRKEWKMLGPIWRALSQRAGE